MLWDSFLIKKLLNKIFTDSVNSTQDPLEKHNLLFFYKKKKKGQADAKRRLSIQTGTYLPHPDETSTLNGLWPKFELVQSS